jgi:hypothetical protein
MGDSSRDEIRTLLKSFGIKADEVIISHLARNPGEKPLKLKLILKDITDYGDASPADSLHLEIDGEIRR